MGRGKHLTIDEWFYHWFDDEEKLPLVSKLFIQIFEVCDTIVFQKGNRHAHKFFELANKSSMYPPKNRQAVKAIMQLFITNSLKIHYIDDVPEIGKEIIPLLPRKDVYLVQLCLASNDKIFVTSDGTLYQNLKDTFMQLNIRVYMAEDFMNQYPEI